MNGRTYRTSFTVELDPVCFFDSFNGELLIGFHEHGARENIVVIPRQWVGYNILQITEALEHAVLEFSPKKCQYYISKFWDQLKCGFVSSESVG